MAVNVDAQCGTKVISRDRSNYWRYYGLHRDPFMPIVEDNNFFLPASWEQYFDLLQYLCESTNILLSVTGVKGSGKTTFMRHFISQLDKDIQIIRLVGSNVLTSEQLSKTLIKDFNLAKPVGETQEEYWESLCLNLQSGRRPYLLVIDDAHRLPRETLAVMINLIKQQSEHQMRLHILLIGELQLTSLLGSLKENDAPQELVHTIALESFNLRDTEAYIKHRLMAAGLPGGMPLREADVARIFKLSEGVPGRINAVARQVLIDIMQQRQLYSFTHFIRTRRTQLLGAAVILIGLLGLAFILTRGNYDPAFKIYHLLFSQKAQPAAAGGQANNNSETVIPTAIIGQPDTISVTNNAVTTMQTHSPEKNPASTEARNATEINPPPAQRSTALNNMQPMQPAPSANTSHSAITSNNTAATHGWYEAPMVSFKKNPHETANQTAQNTLAAGNSTASNITASLAPVPVTQAPVKPATPAAPASSHNTKTQTPVSSSTPAQMAAPATLTPSQTADLSPATPTASGSALLTFDSPFLSNPSHYTLQLIGAGKETSIKQFIAKNQLGDEAHYYHTTLRGKDWYVVVYGSFATKADAEKALNALPEAVRNMRPWTRTIASVGESMKHMQKPSTSTVTPAGQFDIN